MKFHVCGSAERGRGINTQRMHSLHFEIIRSQFCVVNVQDCLGIEPGGDTNLRRKRKTEKQVRKSTVDVFHTVSLYTTVYSFTVLRPIQIPVYESIKKPRYTDLSIG